MADWNEASVRSDGSGTGARAPCRPGPAARAVPPACGRGRSARAPQGRPVRRDRQSASRFQVQPAAGAVRPVSWANPSRRFSHWIAPRRHPCSGVEDAHHRHRAPVAGDAEARIVAGDDLLETRRVVADTHERRVRVILAQLCEQPGRPAGRFSHRLHRGMDATGERTECGTKANCACTPAAACAQAVTSAAWRCASGCRRTDRCAASDGACPRSAGAPSRCCRSRPTRTAAAR